MRLRGDARAEVGAFEDLQTLLVVLVGVAVLLASTLLNWSALSESHADQELYDEAERIVSSIEGWDRLAAVNHYASTYGRFHLRQLDLEALQNNTQQFEERVRSDMSYNITFDDLDVADEKHDPSSDVFSRYEFGQPAPEGADTLTLVKDYALVFEYNITLHSREVYERHMCRMTVVVWR